MTFISPAYVPQIADLFQGADYDMVTSETITHSNEISEHPLEDPDNSSLVDHIREKLMELSLTIIVSTDVMLSSRRRGDVLVGDADAQSQQQQLRDAALARLDRPVKFMDALLDLKRLHTISTTNWLTVYTGFKRYDNLAITELSFTRDPSEPNVFTIEMSLKEMRVVGAPRATEEFYPMASMRGETTIYGSDELTTAIDRFIAEKTYRNPQSNAMQFLPPKPNYDAIAKGQLRKLGTEQQAMLKTYGTRNTQRNLLTRLGYAKLEPLPSFTKWVDEKYQLHWSFNTMARTWSLTVTGTSDEVHIAGRMVVPGYDLLDGIEEAPFKLVPLRRTSVVQQGDYASLTDPLSDGLTAMFLVAGTPDDFATLIG